MKNKIAFLMGFMALCGCRITREEVQADLWAEEQIPEEYCLRVPELWSFGRFRRVLCKYKPESVHCQAGEEFFEEFIPYCDPASKNYLSMHVDDAAKWLERTTRPERP